MRAFYLFLTLIILLLFNSGISFSQWVATTPAGTNIRCLASNSTGVFAGTFAEGIYLSTDDGTTWTTVNSGLNNKNVQSIAANGSNVFAATYGGGVFFSSDNGSSWSEVNNGLTSLFTLSLALYPPSSVYVGTDGGLLLSGDNGSNWTEAGKFGTGNSVGNILCTGSAVFAAIVTYNGGVYRSTDLCQTWTDITAGVTGNNVRALAYNNSNLYAGTAYNGIYRSTDNGDNWIACNSDLTGDVHAVIPYNSYLFAASGHGFFISTNNGKNWLNKSTGLSNSYVGSLIIHNNYLFAGCGDGWIWKRPLSEITGIKNDNSDLPSAFFLDQNFPNPFNPTTTIGYSIPTTSGVVISIYNILGEKVAGLVNEEKSAGYYQMKWNASNFPGGIYLYELRAGSYFQVKKLLLIK
jgi:photosystem II stability/assembly factor-like uncharacterized protein